MIKSPLLPHNDTDLAHPSIYSMSMPKSTYTPCPARSPGHQIFQGMELHSSADILRATCRQWGLCRTMGFSLLSLLKTLHAGNGRPSERIHPAASYWHQVSFTMLVVSQAPNGDNLELKIFHRNGEPFVVTKGHF